jgi:filamin
VDPERLQFSVVGPDGKPVPTKVVQKPKGTFVIEYTAEKEGPQKIDVQMDGVSIAGSPFSVTAKPPPKVEPAKPKLDLTKCKVYGPGIEGATNGVPTYFTVEARDSTGALLPAGDYSVDVSIEGPKGLVSTQVKDNGDGTTTVHYTPQYTGLYRVDVGVNNAPVAGSPFSVASRRQRADPSKSIAYGLGLENSVGIKPQKFTVEARDSNGNAVKDGGDDCKVAITGPKGPIRAHIKDNGTGIYTVEYTPDSYGDYNVDVKLNGDSIASSPYKVKIEKTSYDFTVRGNGIEDGMVGSTANVEVQVKPHKASSESPDADFGDDLVKIKVKDPHGEEVLVETINNGGGSYDTEYKLTKPGAYTVEVYIDDEKKKEYSVKAISPVDPSKSIAYGPGITGKPVAATPTRFMVETRDKFDNPLPFSCGDIQVKIKDAQGNDVEAKIQNNNDGTYLVDYLPKTAGDYTIDVAIDNNPIAKSPFQVTISPPTYRAQVVGSGLDEIQVNKEFAFGIDLVDSLGEPAGLPSDQVLAYLRGPDGLLISAEVEKDQRGKGYKAKFTPNTIGDYLLDIQVGGKSVGTPTKFKSVAKVDPSKCCARGIEEVVKNKGVRKFFVEAYDAGGERITTGGDDCEVFVTASNGQKVEVSVRDNDNGTYSVEFAYPPPGEVKIEVKMNGQPISNGTWVFNVEPSELFFECRGRGVLGGRIAANADFVVEAKDLSGKKVPLDASRLNVRNNFLFSFFFFIFFLYKKKN